jgi:hypothetical protein
MSAQWHSTKVATPERDHAYVKLAEVGMRYVRAGEDHRIVLTSGPVLSKSWRVLRR